MPKGEQHMESAMNLGEERKPTVTTEAEMQDADTRLSVASLSTQQLQVMANPNYERLVKLIFEGRMIGESANRRSGIEQEKAKSLQAIAEAVEMVHSQGLDVSNPEVDAFLKQSCSAVESFNREVTMTWMEAENTCNLFKKQIGSILSAGSIRAASNVYTGDETEMRARLKRKYAFQILSLNNEIGSRKKKGKLPSDATVILKEWWSKNLVWPYPSEDAKKELEIQTGLSATQINNWFINQRKRHWHKYFKDGRLPQTINEARAVLQQYGIV